MIREDPMRTLEKFLSLAEAEPNSEQVSVYVLLKAQLENGQCILVLDDRGWSTSENWSRAEPAAIRETTLTVVGPGEPAPGASRAQAFRDYWKCIRSLLAAQGIHLSIEELMALEHEVRFGPRLQRLLTGPGH
ncbi:MAG: hypothetical protein ACTJF3_04395 [Glutamicibacter arilaitensis]